ncbi:expansin family protein [Fusarium bulbicola]|nr:expansin family protein [Fusarium bulbicola]
MYFSKLSAVLPGLPIGIQGLAAGPCKPESSQTPTGSSLAESSYATTSNTESDPTGSNRVLRIQHDSAVDEPGDNRVFNNYKVSESSTALPSTTEGTASFLTTTEASESTRDFSSTTEVTTSFATSLEVSESSTILPSTTEETPSTSIAPANEEPQVFTGGSATWVYQNGITSECGSVSQDVVVALDYRRYGQKIRVTAISGRHIGASIGLTIVDVC